MKNIFLLLLFIFLSTGLSAQTKITGFGKLKLDSPITIIKEMGNIVESISYDNDYISKVYKNSTSDNIFELLPDSTQEYQISDVSLDSRVRVFVLPKYPATETIVINSVVLRFFKDRLFEITCDGNEKLYEALTLKYGKPKNLLKEVNHQFTYTYTGKTITKTDQNTTSIWQTNDPNISCSSYLSKYYNDKGEEKFLSFVHLVNHKYNNEIEKAEINAVKRIKNRELLKKKKELEGF